MIWRKENPSWNVVHDLLGKVCDIKKVVFFLLCVNDRHHQSVSLFDKYEIYVQYVILYMDTYNVVFFCVIFFFVFLSDKVDANFFFSVCFPETVQKKGNSAPCEDLIYQREGGNMWLFYFPRILASSLAQMRREKKRK